MKLKGAGVLIENPDGQVLVLHRNRSVPWGNMWGIPGGNIKPGLKPIETAIEKTKAETGLKISEKDLQKVKTFYYKVNSDQVKFHVYKFLLKDKNKKIKIDPIGHDNFLWETPKTLLKRKDLMTGLVIMLKHMYVN